MYFNVLFVRKVFINPLYYSGLTELIMLVEYLHQLCWTWECTLEQNSLVHRGLTVLILYAEVLLNSLLLTGF